MHNIKIFETPQETARNYGEYLVSLIPVKKRFYIALSGGSTPKLLFSYLAGKYADSDIWQNVHFFWGDERCVGPDDTDSNYKLTKDWLLDKINIPSDNIHWILGENDPFTEAKRYQQEISNTVNTQHGTPVFDLVILGLGEDGHTASIFPHQINLLESEKFCEVAQHPVSGQKRITLSGKVINNAREISFLVTGGKKSDRIAEIINKMGDWQTYPAAYINPVYGKLNWFIDKTAASGLSNK